MASPTDARRLEPDAWWDRPRQPAARHRTSPPLVTWWERDFAGERGQVSQVRRWIERLLPECDPREDLLLLASELSANAVVHTRSGLAGGWFSVHVEWSPDLARIVVGDLGAIAASTVVAGAGYSAWTDESGRGLLLVDQIAADWGTACHPGGRCTWFDVLWAFRGGPPLDPAAAELSRTGGGGLAVAGMAVTRQRGRPDLAGNLLGPRTPMPAMGATLSRLPFTRKPIAKGTLMQTTQCLCGFTEQADESLIDHLEQAFTPEDMRGKDGLVHQEMGDLACACGFTAIRPSQLDTHFLAVFMTADGIDRDGRQHGILAGA